MRRFIHLFALLALIMMGSVPELPLEATEAPRTCCCGAPGCGCGMPAKGPGPSQSPGPSLAAPVSLSAEPQAPQSQAEPQREPKPWPTRLANALRRGLGADCPRRGPPALAPSPPDRLALLATFRI